MSKHAPSLSYLFDVQKGERLKTFLLFSWLLLIICSYYVLRPVRRGMVLDGLGNEMMPFIYIGTALVTGVVVWIYSKYAHLPRKKLITAIYGIFFVNLLMFWQAFQFESKITSGVFWVWLDVFSIMSVTLFWMYANDIFNSSSAKRLFGIVAGGGGLGAVLGSTITASLVSQLGATNMLLVAAGIVVLSSAIFLFVENKLRPGSTDDLKVEAGTAQGDTTSGFIPNKNVTPIKDANSSKNAASSMAATSTKGDTSTNDASSLKGALKLILENKFLLFLALVVCFERTTPDMVQFLYQEALKNLATGRDAIVALDADIERWRGIAEVGVELFLVAAVIRKFGSGICLASNGIAIAGSLIAFAVIANPFVIVAIFHADEAMRHSWFKSAKELTYTVTSRQVLYTLKPFIEMFCYRFSRGFAGLLIFLVYSVMGFGTNGIIAMGVASGLFWAFCGWQLSKEYKRRDSLARMLESSPEPLPVSASVEADKELTTKS